MIESALAALFALGCGIWMGATAEGRRVRREYCDRVSVTVTSVDGEDDVDVGVRVAYHFGGKVVAAKDIEMRAGVQLDLVTRVCE